MRRRRKSVDRFVACPASQKRRCLGSGGGGGRAKRVGGVDKQRVLQANQANEETRSLRRNFRSKGSRPRRTGGRQQENKPKQQGVQRGVKEVPVDVETLTEAEQHEARFYVRFPYHPVGHRPPLPSPPCPQVSSLHVPSIRCQVGKKGVRIVTNSDGSKSEIGVTFLSFDGLLFRCAHTDGDEEELELHEVRAATERRGPRPS